MARLLGTTKETIAKVRDRTHWNAVNIKPHNPVLLGLCKQADLDAALKRAQRRVQREQKAAGIDPNAAPTQPTPEGDTFANIADQEQPSISDDDMMKGLG